MASQDDIERNKDKQDLKPNIDFVSRHMSHYDEGIKRLYSLPVSVEGKRFADSIEFKSLECFVDPQLSAGEIRQIVSSMPQSLIMLSNLVDVTYEDKIPVPIYDDSGNFSGSVNEVSHKEFPRPGDHPSRVLVGMSNGYTIWQTPIPRSVSEDERAVKAYQTHVFLHEYFHTIESPRRNPEARHSVLMECDGDKFTMQDIWNGFKQLYLRHDRVFVSRYSSIYADRLNLETKAANLVRFNQALAEQICESFAGYMLGIISNDNNETDFAKAHPENHRLIDMMYRGKVIQKD